MTLITYPAMLQTKLSEYSFKPSNLTGCAERTHTQIPPGISTNILDKIKDALINGTITSSIYGADEILNTIQTFTEHAWSHWTAKMCGEIGSDARLLELASTMHNNRISTNARDAIQAFLDQLTLDNENEFRILTHKTILETVYIPALKSLNLCAHMQTVTPKIPLNEVRFQQTGQLGYPIATNTSKPQLIAPIPLKAAPIASRYVKEEPSCKINVDKSKETTLSRKPTTRQAVKRQEKKTTVDVHQSHKTASDECNIQPLNNTATNVTSHNHPAWNAQRDLFALLVNKVGLDPEIVIRLKKVNIHPSHIQLDDNARFTLENNEAKIASKYFEALRENDQTRAILFSRQKEIFFRLNPDGSSRILKLTEMLAELKSEGRTSKTRDINKVNLRSSKIIPDQNELASIPEEDLPDF